MTQMTQKQSEQIVRMTGVLQSSNYAGEILDVIHDFMYAMPDSGPLDAKVAQELFNDTPNLQDIDAQDANGDTLLHHFMRHSDGQNEEHKQALENILSYNPNPFVENNDGKTPAEEVTNQNALAFSPVMAKYANKCTKHTGQQLQDLIAYAVIEPDMNKELAEFKTSRQGFMAIANRLSGKKDNR